MPYYERSEIRLSDVFRTMRRYWWRGVVPAVAVAAAVCAYGVFRRPTWEVSQAVTVRNEAASTWNAPGKFRHDNEMKMLVETVLEVAMSPSVLKATLSKVGPPVDWTSTGVWPTEKDVESLRQAVTLAAPNGSEFGKTEIFYLKVKDTSRSRAFKIVGTLFEQIDRNLAKLRDQRIQGTVAELDKASVLARTEFAVSNERLAVMEQEMGGDLVELRLLHQSASGSSDLQRTFVDAQNELRQLQQAHTVSADLLALIKTAQTNPQSLLAAPNALLESQPTVKRLKDGLSDAQLRTVALLSVMTERHPRVIASRQAEKSIHSTIVEELAVAARGVEAESNLLSARIKLVDEQLGQMREQRDRLARFRAEYSNLTSAVENRRSVLEQAERSLAEAKANQAAAQSCSLISLLDEPDGKSKPLGPGRTLIAGAGVCGGLLTGLGLLFLTAPLPAPTRSLTSGIAPVWSEETSRVSMIDKSPGLKRCAKNGRLRMAEVPIPASQPD